MDKGVVLARFQVIHLKHIEYILAAKMRCDKLFIGVIDPDDMYTADDADLKELFLEKDNPLTYFERYEMLHDAVMEFGMRREEFEIIPFPLRRPEYILKYAPIEAKYFVTICDQEDEEKKQILSDLDLSVEVMWQRSPKERGVTGGEIRDRIVLGQEWEQLVPKSVFRYMMEQKIDRRIKKLAQESEGD